MNTKVVLLACLAIILAGCAATKDALHLNYVPRAEGGIGETDRTECRALAVEKSKELGTGYATNTILGAVTGAIVGLGISSHPFANTTAGTLGGAGAGGLGGRFAADPDPHEETFRKCLQDRGYKVLD